MDSASLSVDCCVVGGGPAGMMLGFLLARAGISVAVLEKHKDFLRDFRGDTIHPSTLRLMDELGLLDELLALPHQKARELRGQIGDFSVPIADFTHLSERWGFIALMPQWDFLDFIAAQGRRFKTFDLRMQAAATGLIEEDGQVTGVRVDTPNGPLEVRAKLTVGCDGRHSLVRDEAGLTVEDLGAPMDVLWFALSRGPDDPQDTVGRFDAGRIFIMINRGTHWQCGLVIPKGTFATLRTQGLEAFRAALIELAPFLGGRENEIAGWDDVKLLTVSVDRLVEWRGPGCSASAMPPIRCRRSAGSGSIWQSKMRWQPPICWPNACASVRCRLRIYGAFSDAASFRRAQPRRPRYSFSGASSHAYWVAPGRCRRRCR